MHTFSDSADLLFGKGEPRPQIAKSKSLLLDNPKFDTVGDHDLFTLATSKDPSSKKAAMNLILPELKGLLNEKDLKELLINIACGSQSCSDETKRELREIK